MIPLLALWRWGTTLAAGLATDLQRLGLVKGFTRNQAVLAMLARFATQFDSYQPRTAREGIFEVYVSATGRKVRMFWGIELGIRRGERIGFIGSTGSGKSTTVDTIMGLLAPSAGRVLGWADLHDPLTVVALACSNCPCSSNHFPG